MTDTDIVLLDGQVKIEACDLCVDSKDRRINNTELRRALVHDYDDKLTLNWGGDYPNGVKIVGKIEATDNLTVNGNIKAGSNNQIKIEACDLCVDFKDRRINNTKFRRALVHDYDDKLTLNWGGDYPNGVKIVGKIEATDNLTVKNGLTISNNGITIYDDNKSPSAGLEGLSSSVNRPAKIKISGSKIEYTTSSIIMPGHLGLNKPNTIDLIAEIIDLRQEINDLKAKLNQ